MMLVVRLNDGDVRRARERYYLRHRLVRLLRRRQRMLAWLELCARAVGSALRAPDRNWFMLREEPATSWSFRLFAQHGERSDWQHVVWPKRALSARECVERFGVDPAAPGGDQTAYMVYERGRGVTEWGVRADVNGVVWKLRNGRVWETRDGQTFECSQRPQIGRWDVQPAENYELLGFDEASSFDKMMFDNLQKTTAPLPHGAPRGVMGHDGGCPTAPPPFRVGPGHGAQAGPVPYPTCKILQAIRSCFR